LEYMIRGRTSWLGAGLGGLAGVTALVSADKGYRQRLRKFLNFDADTRIEKAGLMRKRQEIYKKDPKARFHDELLMRRQEAVRNVPETVRTELGLPPDILVDYSTKFNEVVGRPPTMAELRKAKDGPLSAAGLMFYRGEVGPELQGHFPEGTEQFMRQSSKEKTRRPSLTGMSFISGLAGGPDMFKLALEGEKAYDKYPPGYSPGAYDKLVDKVQGTYQDTEARILLPASWAIGKLLQAPQLVTGFKPGPLTNTVNQAVKGVGGYAATQYGVERAIEKGTNRLLMTKPAAKGLIARMLPKGTKLTGATVAKGLVNSIWRGAGLLEVGFYGSKAARQFNPEYAKAMNAQELRDMQVLKEHGPQLYNEWFWNRLSNLSGKAAMDTWATWGALAVPGKGMVTPFLATPMATGETWGNLGRAGMTAYQMAGQEDPLAAERETGAWRGQLARADIRAREDVKGRKVSPWFGAASLVDPTPFRRFYYSADPFTGEMYGGGTEAYKQQLEDTARTETEKHMGTGTWYERWPTYPAKGLTLVKDIAGALAERPGTVIPGVASKKDWQLLYDVMKHPERVESRPREVYTMR